MDMELQQSVKMSIIFLICLCWRVIYAQVEWHLSDIVTLNTSSQSGSPVSINSPGLNFDYDLSSWINASSGIQNPYSYLCFISYQSHAFILSICTTSHNMGDNFDYHTPIVWSANRQSPAQGKLITLTLQADGDLVLQGDQDMAPVWSTGTGKKGVVKMQLLQFPINLVLYDTHNTVVWQSLDHPCDTLTAFQTLRAGMKLVSWTSPNDPSEGNYSLVVGNGFVTLYTSSLYTEFQPIPYWNWSSSALHEDIVTVSQLGFLMSDTTSIVDLNYEGDPVLPCMPTTDQVNKTFLRLESDGILHLYTLTTLQWTDLCHIPSAQNCSLPNQCGPYGICSTGGNCACPNAQFFSPLKTSDLTAGCMLINKLPRCNESIHKTALGMLRLPGIDYFSTSYSPSIPDISSEEICQDTCLSNCSCIAALWHAHSLGCFHVDYQIGSLQQASRNESLYRAYLKVRSPPSSQNHTSNRLKLSISIPVSFLVFCAISVLTCWKLQSKDSKQEEIKLDALLGLPTRYTYAELQAITNNFSMLLGKGGYGAVYKGALDNGTEVAVKQLHTVNNADKEFRSELAIMAGIHHYNLLRLLGFCAQGRHRLLVYEYMENGSLDTWLFNHSGGEDGSHVQCNPLPWSVRLKIAVGTANGLDYLHRHCQEKIIHLDVKPQNILLDKNFVPKVADFGLSRLVGREGTQMMTTMKGTPGYLAPEWLKQTVIDEKSDVFSFGMLLLEIISGRKNLDVKQESPERIYYPEWAFMQAQGSAQIEAQLFTDAELHEEEEFMQARRMIKTAFLCLLEEPSLRPSMEQVILMLEGRLDVMSVQLSSLLQGLFFVLRNSANYNLMQETLKHILAPIDVSTTDSSFSHATMSLEISTR